jgi:hypothetical protein
LHTGSKGNLIFQKVDENMPKRPIQAKRPEAIQKTGGISCQTGPILCYPFLRYRFRLSGTN